MKIIEKEKLIAAGINFERMKATLDTGLDKTHSADPKRFSSRIRAWEIMIVAIDGNIVAII